MLSLHPNILECDGKKAFAVLPYEEFVKIEEALGDLDDLRALRAAKVKEADAPAYTLAAVRSELKI